MSEIRKLNNEELKDYIEIVTNAYPGFMNPSIDIKEVTLKKFIERQVHDDSLEYVGLFRNNKLSQDMLNQPTACS